MTGLSAHAIAAAGTTPAVNHDAAHPVSLRESTGEGIYGFDREGRCTFAIRARAQSLRYRTDAVPGRTMHQRVHHAHADRRSYSKDERPIQSAYRQSLPCRLDHEIFRRVGEQSPLAAHCLGMGRLIDTAADKVGRFVTDLHPGILGHPSLWTALVGRARQATAVLVDGAASPSSRTIHDPLEMSA